MKVVTNKARYGHIKCIERYINCKWLMLYIHYHIGGYKREIIPCYVSPESIHYNRKILPIFRLRIVEIRMFSKTLKKEFFRL